MMTSMYSGVSGLKAQQTKLDVIGNNIANISTAGYKSQRVSFSDILSQTISSATGPSTASNRGGTNPMQVGLGVTVSSVDTNMGTGSTETTGNSMDVSIGGDGFFIVKGASGDYEFTRAGNFGVDSSGNLTVNGLKVCGWEQYSTATDGTYKYNTQKTVEPINLFSDSYNGNKKMIAPKATSNATLSGNLDPTATAKGTDLTTIGTSPATADSTATMTIYDTMGNSYDVQVKLSKCYTDTDTTSSTYGNTSWYWEAAPSSSSNVTIGTPSSGYIEFDSNGKLVTDNTSFSTTPCITFTPDASVGSAAFTAKLDMSGISTYTSSTSSSVTANADGYAAGELQDISIGSDGIITGSYSNGQKQPLAELSLATFTNPSGLEKIGTNLYVTTTNSGKFTGGVEAGTNGTGTLNSGSLEGSNVDLAGQFSDMMITQRAYQANSKIITTSDNMMETLINMIR